MRFSSCLATASLLSLATLASGGVVGCSSSDSSGSPTSPDASFDGGTTKDSSVDDGSMDGGVVSLANATKIAADSEGGGFTPAPPDGSVCAYGAQHYAVDVVTKLFTFKRCVSSSSSAGSPLVLDEGSQTLTAVEYAKVTASIEALTPPRIESCGADKSFLSVTVTTSSSGDTMYADSFYACRKEPGKTYVDNIEAVFSTFQSFAPAK